MRCSDAVPANGKREQALIHSGLLRRPLQFSVNATRTSRRSSARHPGKSANRAGVQRAFGSVGDAITATGGPTAGMGLGSVATTTGAEGAGVTAEAGAGKGCIVPHPVTISATKIKTLSDAVMLETVAMIESGMWIFLVEAVAAGCLFIGLIWWVVKGTGERDRKLKEFDDKARKDAEATMNVANKANNS